jgi:hypothetical protein
MESLEYLQRKYYKYKYKYKNLKQYGGDPDFIDTKTIYLKFITEKIIPLSEDEIHFDVKRVIDDTHSDRAAKASRKSTRLSIMPIYLNEYYLNLTPEILKNLTPLDEKKMINDFEIDDKYIEKLRLNNETYDSEYVLYENYGKTIECWIADNMSCPCCKTDNSLRRYANESMPIIDLVCVNPAHTIKNGVKFFQVKTSNGNFFNELPYFNYDESESNINANTIHVGSVRWGHSVHNITPNNPEFEKRILCGYICIQFDDRRSDKIIFDLEKSFIVLPQYLIRTDARKKLFGEPIIHSGHIISADGGPASSLTISDLSDKDMWYYKYIDSDIKHPRIRFNLKTNNILKISEIISSKDFDLPYTGKSYLPITNPLNIYEIK